METKALVRGNPFETLGLTPDSLRGLSKDQVMELVKTSYMVQQEFYNPAFGGLGRKFDALMEAWAALQDPEIFESALDSYLAPREDQVKALQREVRRYRVLSAGCSCING